MFLVDWAGLGWLQMTRMMIPKNNSRESNRRLYLYDSENACFSNRGEDHISRLKFRSVMIRPSYTDLDMSSPDLARDV